MKNYSLTNVKSPTRNCQVTRAGGICSNKPVDTAHGDLIKFLLVENFDRLKVICCATAEGWNGPRKFESSKNALAGKGLERFHMPVADRHPNAADKTNTNYEELTCLSIPTTDLGTTPIQEIRSFASISSRR